MGEVKSTQEKSYEFFGGATDGMTVIGASHISTNTPCQDFGGYIIADLYGAVAVADGHGSSKHFRSGRGSQFAVEVFFELLQEISHCCDVDAPDNIKEYIKQQWVKVEKIFTSDSDVNCPFFMDKTKLCDDFAVKDFLTKFTQQFLVKWHEKVSTDIDLFPFSEDELSSQSDKIKERAINREIDYKIYGSTFIGVAKFESIWFCVNIGDGDVVIVSDDGVISKLFEPEDEAIGESVESLCGSNAVEKFDVFYSLEPFPQAVYITTDGVGKSFDSDDAFYKIFDTITTLMQSEGRESTMSKLNSHLKYITKNGSGDDVSISGIVRCDQ